MHESNQRLKIEIARTRSEVDFKCNEYARLSKQLDDTTNI